METLKIIVSMFVALLIWTLVASNKLWALTIRDLAEAIVVAAVTTVPCYYLQSSAQAQRGPTPMTFRLCLQLWVVLAALTLISATGAEALAASNILHPTNFQDASLRLLGESAQVTSWWATRFYPGKPQTHEFSCGPAALANLLSVFFGLAVDEAAIIQDGIEQDRGVSLHYLLESARSLGFQAAVYRMDAECCCGYSKR